MLASEQISNALLGHAELQGRLSTALRDFGNFKALVEQTVDLQQAELRPLRDSCNGFQGFRALGRSSGIFRPFFWCVGGVRCAGLCQELLHQHLLRPFLEGLGAAARPRAAADGGGAGRAGEEAEPGRRSVVGCIQVCKWTSMRIRLYNPLYTLTYIEDIHVN